MLGEERSWVFLQPPNEVDSIKDGKRGTRTSDSTSHTEKKYPDKYKEIVEEVGTSEERKAPMAAAIGKELASRLNLKKKKTFGLSRISFDFNKKKPLSFHFLLILLFVILFIFVLFCYFVVFQLVSWDLQLFGICLFFILD